MIGVMGSFEYPSADLNEPLDCYLHGYVSARLMRQARDFDKGVPVTIAATKVDGLVPSLTPNSHSMNYRSAVLQGYAKPVEKVEEKLWAMEKITNKVVTQRWENTKSPPDGAEMSSTCRAKTNNTWRPWHMTSTLNRKLQIVHIGARPIKAQSSPLPIHAD